MAANDRQVGGEHYKTGGEEHWDRVWRLYGRGYFIGCITKYVERYQNKNGVQDLNKAAHFLQKLIELETTKDDTKAYCPIYGSTEENLTVVHKEGCPEKPSHVLSENGQHPCPWCWYDKGHAPNCDHPGYVDQT